MFLAEKIKELMKMGLEISILPKVNPETQHLYYTASVKGVLDLQFRPLAEFEEMDIENPEKVLEELWRILCDNYLIIVEHIMFGEKTYWITYWHKDSKCWTCFRQFNP